MPACPPPPPPIPEAVMTAGEVGVRQLTGNILMPLDDPERAWLVQSGSVDTMLAETMSGTPSGSHHYLFTLQSGDLMFGVAADDGDVRLVARGLAGASLVEMDMRQVRAMASSAATAADLAGKIDRWAGAVTEALARPFEPRPAVVALPRVRAGRDGAAGSGGATGSLHLSPNLRHGVFGPPLWLAVSGGSLQFLDIEEVSPGDAGDAFPLYPGGWLSVSGPAVAQTASTLEMVQNGRCWTGLAALNRLLLTLLPLNLRVNAVDEINRRRRRNALNQDATRQSLDVMSEVLEPSAGLSAAVIVGHDPLFDACAAIASAMGFEAVAPFAPTQGARTAPEDALPALEPFLRTNHLRSRDIVLEQGWWRDETPPFLLFRQSDRRPLAVLPAAGRRYRLFDPIERTQTILTAAAARALAGTAITFHQPLPAERLTGPVIARLIARCGRADFLSLLGFGVAAGILGMAPPVAIGYLVGTAIPGHDREGLWTMGAILVVLSATLFLIRLAVQVAALRIEGLVGTFLQAGVFDRLLRLPATFCRQFTAGDLMIRTLAIERIQTAITGSAISTLLNGALGLASVSLLLWYDARLGMVAVALVAAFCLFALVVGWLRMRCEREVMTLTSAVTSLTLQLAVGIAKLRLVGAEERVFLKWSRLYARLAGRRYQISRLDAVFASIKGAYGLAALAVIFTVIWAWSGPAETADGRAAGALPSLGTLLAFLSAYAMAFTNITGLVATVIQLAALAPVWRHAAPILDATPEVDSTKADPGVLSGALELSRVCFRYGPDLPPVFTDFSLTAAAGEFVAVVGPSGCGKSTLLRLLLGFETPTSGAILYNGADLRGLDPLAVRRQLGVVMQNGKLMPGSLLDNILGANVQFAEDDAWEAAERVGLAADIRAMPMGMQTVVTEGGAFSGGQVQRILIARAIIAKPRILLLDEATSALDNRTQAIVTDSLDRLAVTRLVIAHRLSTVVNAHRIIVLDKGRAVESGRYQDLISADGPFARFAHRQLA